MSQEDTTRPPTTDELRRRVDRGDTGDKVNFPEPAAVPLGASAEARGAAPTSTEREIAARQELRGESRITDASRLAPRSRSMPLGALLVLVLLAVVCVIGLAAVLQ